MTLVCERQAADNSREYEVRLTAETGDLWLFHFQSHQVQDVLRRGVHHHHRGHLTLHDLERLYFVVEDIVAIEQLPPVSAEPSRSWLARWVDSVAEWFCKGK